MAEPYKQNFRKDVSTLLGDERKRFFWCLKMIGILPPPPIFRTWTYTTIVGRQQSPVNLHDVLIASHASTCQHSCFYFPSYHRNQLILAEVFLNYADQVLTNKVIPTELNAPAFKNAWVRVFTEYQQVLKTQKGKVCFHYWNPTNHKNPQSLTFPPELDEKQPENYDSMDQLFLLVRKSLPWSIYPLERLYNNNSRDFNRDDFVSSMQSFLIENDPDIQQYENSQEYQNLISGTTNFRETPSQAYSAQNNFRGGYSQALVKQRNYNQYVLQNHQDVKSLNLKRDEVLVSYNSSAKNLQYLTTAQRDKIVNSGQLQRNQVNQFNLNAPHYSLANGIYNSQYQKFQNFASSGIVPSHNIMHNYGNAFLNHSMYSPTSLMFFLYHGWIDAEVEIRIRTDQNQSSFIQSQFMYANMNAAGGESAQSASQLYKIINQSKFLQINQQQLTGLQSNPKLKPTSVGYYPILSWSTAYMPSGSQANSFQFISYFSTYEYYITSSRELRRSYQMGEIYQKRFYNAVKDGFHEFQGLAKYNYNYNYEYLSGENDKTILLPNDTGVNIPLYLQEIARNLISGAGSSIALKSLPKTAALHAVLSEAKKEKVGSSVGKPKIEQHQHQKKQQVKGEFLTDKKKQVIQYVANKIGNQDPSYYNKLLNRSIVALIKYQSTISSGAYQVGFKLKDAETIRPSISESNINYFDKVSQEGIKIHTQHIFSRFKDAVHCIKCKQFKYHVIELGEDLYNAFPQLWRQIAKYILTSNRIVASTKEEIKKHCYTHWLQAYAKQPVKVQLVTGAEKVYFQTHYKGNKKGTIRVQAESNSVLKNQIFTTASHVNYNLTKGFEFYKLWDSNLTNNYIDSYVYNKIRIIVSIGSEVKSLHFSIPSYHKLIRYIINIEEQGDDFELEVEDADFQFKKRFIEEYGPEKKEKTVKPLLIEKMFT